MKKRYLSDSEFAAMSERELISEHLKCEVMQRASGSSVGRKTFGKRLLEVERELLRRKEQRDAPR